MDVLFFGDDMWNIVLRFEVEMHFRDNVAFVVKVVII